MLATNASIRIRKAHAVAMDRGQALATASADRAGSVQVQSLPPAQRRKRQQQGADDGLRQERHERKSGVVLSGLASPCRLSEPVGTGCAETPKRAILARKQKPVDDIN